MDILDLLRADGSIVVNKKLAHEIGLVEAVIYSELVSLYKYWSDRGELVDGKWFYCTADNLEKNTTLKRKPQDRGIKRLEELGLIEVTKMGLPAKRYFAITDNIHDLFSNGTNKDVQKGQTDNINVPEENDSEKPHNDQLVQKEQTVMSKRDKLERPKRTINNTRTNNTKNNTENNRERDLLKGLEIEAELKEFIEGLLPTFKDKGINVQQVISWLGVNHEVYTYREFAIGLKQMLEYPETIEKPINFLNSTFVNIEDYVKAHDKKIQKRDRKKSIEQKHQQEPLQEYQRKVPFYNWLEQ